MTGNEVEWLDLVLDPVVPWRCYMVRCSDGAVINSGSRFIGGDGYTHTLWDKWTRETETWQTTPDKVKMDGPFFDATVNISEYLVKDVDP